MSSEILAIFIFIGGVMGLVGFVVSCICVAIISGFVRSTHTVQYVPHDNTPAFEPETTLLEENEKALFDKVGKKTKPTVVEDLDAPIEEIMQSDIKF